MFCITALLYSWNSDHDFHLDCAHGLVDNESIRDLSFIPSYFIDAKTLTALPQNADYRPILQITYALNYWVSGYEMWSYHLTHIFLHSLNAFFLIVLARLWLPHLAPNASSARRFWLPLWVGVFFVVHPMFSGVVNYQWARSSMLTTAFLLPAICCWMSGRYRWAWGLYTLALFTKIEAVGALGVFALWNVFQVTEARRREHWQDRPGLVKDVCRLFRWNRLPQWWFLLAVTALYAVIRHAVMPPWHTELRSASDITHVQYLLTQITAWWHYIFEWWAPVDLVADDLSYPIYRSLGEPVVLLSICGWLAVALGCRLNYARRPAYLVLTLSALALISPTSSIMPLAEMVNEHRPYMPLGVLSIVFLTIVVNLGTRWMNDQKIARAAGHGLVWIVLGVMIVLNVHRTQAFTSMTAYWADVVSKAPSWRSKLNYGISLLHLNRFDEAEEQMHGALKLAPYDPFILVNLGILNHEQQRYAAAGDFFDSAVRVSLASKTPNTLAFRYRAWFRLQQKNYGGALEDLRVIEGTERRRGPMYQNIAAASAGSADWRTAFDYTLKAAESQPHLSRDEVVSTVIPPFWGDAVVVNAGLQYFAALHRAWPDVDVISTNWVALAERQSWLFTEAKDHQSSLEALLAVQGVLGSMSSAYQSRLAGAYAALGRIDEAIEHTMNALDARGAMNDIDVLTIVKPFWNGPTARARGLKFFRQLYTRRGSIPAFMNNWSILSFNESLERVKNGEFDHALELLNFSEKHGQIELTQLLGRRIECYAGLGHVDDAIKATLRFRDEKISLPAQVTQRMVTPFWSSPELNRRGLVYFRRLSERWPGQFWIHQYWSELAEKSGLMEEAQNQRRHAQSIRVQ